MVRTRVLAAVAALAAALVISCLASAPAAAYIEQDGYVWLLDDGGTNLATTDWRFYVEIPEYLTTEDETWDIIVYGQLVNSTGSAATGTWTVTAYVDDGIINRSAAGTVVLDLAAKSYGNISFPQSTIELFSANNSAALTLTLSNGTVQDTYVTTIPIYGSSSSGISHATIGLMVGLFSVAMIVIIMPLVLRR